MKIEVPSKFLVCQTRNEVRTPILMASFGPFNSYYYTWALVYTMPAAGHGGSGKLTTHHLFFSNI